MFGTIDIKSRPLRLAYLVDPNNAKQVREAIRLSSTLWGGDYFPIIPIHKRIPATWEERPLRTPSAKNIILGYIEAFDPDVLIQISKEVPQYIKNLGLEIIKPDEIWQDLDDDGNLSPKFGIGIFEILNEIFKKNFMFKMKYPIEIIFPIIPRQYTLFWTSLFGDIPNKILLQLEKHYFEPLEIKKSIFKIENLNDLMHGKVLFPRRITRHSINNYNRSGFRRDAYVYFMDATKTDDIVDYWNLRAIGKSVFPLPKQLKENPQIKTLLINFLKEHRIPWKHNPSVCDRAIILRSRNSSMNELQDYSKTLQIDRESNDLSNDGFFVLQHWYPRVWDEWARDKDNVVPDDIYGEDEISTEIAETKDLRIKFQSLLPKFAQKYGYHGKPRCGNEISFRFYGSNEYIAEVLPKSSGEEFIIAISSLTSFKGDWRVGRNGLVKLVKSDFIETLDIPLAENVFFAWLEDLGWKSKLSSAGLMAKQIHNKLDGHLAVLTNEKLLGLLEHMSGGRVKHDGSPVENNIINQERELAVGEVKNRLKAISVRGNLHDYLVERGIFKLGLRVQCSHCSRNSWFSLDKIQDILSCPLCLNTFAAIGNIEDAVWCYKTAGPFTVPNYVDGAYTVLLTADFFNDRKMSTMRITPALSFIAESAENKNIEADIAALWQESIHGVKQNGILFGECKTYNSFKKRDFDRIRYLAKNFPGSILVFSTLRKSLSTNEKVEITRIAKAGRKYWKADRPINPILILTGNELLHNSGPPYCWEDSVKKKFGRVVGIIELADATQQLYLNLPSWHKDWQERWQKKRTIF